MLDETKASRLFATGRRVAMAWIAAPTAVLAANLTVSDNPPDPIEVDNNDPGFEERTLTVTETGTVDQLTVTLDFHPITGGGCASPGTGVSHSDEVAFRLTSPSGTSLPLVVNRGGFDPDNDGPTYTNDRNVGRVQVTLDDSAANLVGTTNGGLPEDGTFRPWRDLAAFQGEDIQGDWILGFQDDVAFDPLCYYGASLSFTTTKIDLDDGDPETNNSVTYADEIALNGGSATLSASARQDLEAALGFGASAGSERSIRLDLSSGARFANDPSMDLLGDAGTLVSGGAGEDFAIFEISPSVSRGPQAEVTFDVNGIAVTSHDNVTARYRLYETASAAANEGTALADTQAPAYRFAPALTVAANDPDRVETINVATNATQFVGDVFDATTTEFADIDIGLNSERTVLWRDSEEADVADLVASGTALVVDGDFSAVPRQDGDLDPSQVTLDGQPADALSATEARFDLGTTTGNLVGIMNVTGQDEIIPGPYTGVYDVTAAADARAIDSDLGELSILSKNGSSASTNINLDPNGNFRNFVRITNRSGIDGEVVIKLINDAGESVRMELGDIAGQQTILPGQASTDVIPMSDVMAAAQAIDAGFPLASQRRNKLRMEVEGDFPEIAVDNITAANDGSTFHTFD